MRVMIGGLAHETNTFSNVPSTLELFQSWEWSHKEEILVNHRKVRDYLGGMVDRAEELGIELLPTFWTFGYPSGTITKEAYAVMKKELLDAIQEAGQADAICLSLHGAGVAEEVDDLEGDLLAAIRAQVGYEIPLIATLDLHANMTQRMVSEADALLSVHLYPHVDCYERGIEAIDLARKMVEENCRPTMHLTRLPLVIPTSATHHNPVKDINDACWAWEKEAGVIDCALIHGFPYTDIPELGISILAITDNDRDLAKKVSEDIARLVWEKRDEFELIKPTPAEGIALALESEGMPIVINETSDNPGGGTPGDGTYLLQAMLDAKLTNACFGFIYDPEVVQQAYQAGVGATIAIQLGGKTDHLHGEPISVNAYVKCLTDGKFIATTPMGQGGRVNYGKSVRLQIDGIDVVVCSVKSQVLDEQIFQLHGIDVTKYKIVALKSSTHFRAAYEPISAKVITVDSPGLTTLNFRFFKYERVERPIYPLDPITDPFHQILTRK
ncbi:microcystinase C [Brevibacillus reuszeri]|uniref:Microcystinase C n=1 Tax=Brevibacillus reuszeri TaxID=54915 RepID=A0A0K9YIN3_9BACL|nr:M81 family metallopeptidase [Brevibacillus reuszeri]KNB68531.1 MlrC domain protein [Brevibacillus reuszeri]MED1858810.1 M81 family metallopeptidase [Brevibacillus reuszeri]GED69025.1 microcystinase C [Brevibacillus reuszeri]